MTAKITRHHGNLPNVVISPLTAVTQDILAKFDNVSYTMQTPRAVTIAGTFKELENRFRTCARPDI